MMTYLMGGAICFALLLPCILTNRPRNPFVRVPTIISLSVFGVKFFINAFTIYVVRN